MEDPDQLASLEASRSGSTLFSKEDISGFNRRVCGICTRCKLYCTVKKVGFLMWRFNQIYSFVKWCNFDKD